MNDFILYILYVATFLYMCYLGYYVHVTYREGYRSKKDIDQDTYKAILEVAQTNQQIAEDLCKVALQLDQQFMETSNSFFKEKADEIREVADQFALLAHTGTCAYSTEELTNKLRRIQAEIDQLPTHP